MKPDYEQKFHTLNRLVGKLSQQLNTAEELLKNTGALIEAADQKVEIVVLSAVDSMTFRNKKKINEYTRASHLELQKYKQMYHASNELVGKLSRQLNTAEELLRKTRTLIEVADQETENLVWVEANSLFQLKVRQAD